MSCSSAFDIEAHGMPPRRDWHASSFDLRAAIFAARPAAHSDQRSDAMIRPLASFAAVLAIPLSLAACGVTFVGPECKLGDTTFAPGETVPAPDGCNTCTCQDDGTAICTRLACVTSCEYMGQSFAIGDTFPAGDGCNTCECTSDGNVACTHMACVATCTWNGQTYPVGASFPAGDGCNTCECMPDGNVGCTAVWCGDGCVYAGTSYQVGESFPALDGCNTCTCEPGGVVGCTKIACACDPSSEWWRKYVAQDPAQCAVIDFACPASTTYFENGCGCGCEQDASCPQVFDCMPPAMCDTAAIMAKCPYSIIAF
jgi:hypothetical protein